MTMADVPVPRAHVDARRSGRARRRRKAGDRLVLYALAAIAFIVLAGPLLWMVASALKTRTEVLANPPSVLPADPQLGNFADVFEQVPFARYMLNSALVATVVTLVSLLFHSMAAYSLARLRYPGRNAIFLAILSTLMVPFTVIFLLRQFYLSIPRELEEAAIVDGASLMRVYWSIILPLSRPILAALGIFFFLANWNNFLWPLVVTQSQDLWVVQLGIQQFTGERGSQYHLIMAASTLAALPTLLLFFVLQRRLVEGIKLTGLKG
jgi:multiple sugar transport system permease protein